MKALPTDKVRSLAHSMRVRQELKALGASNFVLATSESRYLPRLIHPEEHIGALIYGHHKDGFAILVATDMHVIFLDKKPLFVNQDDISYSVVSGVSYSNVGFDSVVTLHTRIKDYAIRSFNNKCVAGFVKYIESQSIEHAYTGGLQGVFRLT